MKLLAVSAILWLLAACGNAGSTPVAVQTPSQASSASASAALTPSPVFTPSPSPATLLTVNASGGSSSLPLAWIFQIQYPSRYLVTDDAMVTSYNSQGGMAPPRLAFTVGNQLMSLDVSLWDLMQAGNQDCILIWSTRGFQSISDWEQLLQSRGSVSPVSETAQQFGSFKFVVREVAGERVHSIEAFVQLPPDLSYFFNTCNLASKTDLFTMLPTFKVRT